jgi:hypothetical protein
LFFEIINNANKEKEVREMTSQIFFGPNDEGCDHDDYSEDSDADSESTDED